MSNLDRIAQLERRAADLEAQIRSLLDRNAALYKRRQPRLAITAADPDDPNNYPEGNVVWIKFVDATWDDESGAGDITIDKVERQEDAKALAALVGGTRPAEGTLVEVFWDRGRWWIPATSDDEVWEGQVYGSAFTTGSSSFDVKICFSSTGRYAVDEVISVRNLWKPTASAYLFSGAVDAMAKGHVVGPDALSNDPVAVINLPRATWVEC